MKTIRKLKLALLFLIIIGNFNSKAYSQDNYNYSEALQKSLFFYEAQQSGKLSSTNRVSWRASSGMTDGSDVGKDLTGGWYDAGDHVKFGFPMAYTATMLGWGAIDFKAGYEKSGQLTAVKNNLRYVYDYLIKCHTAPNELYGQVGNGSADHSFWGAPEIMKMARPSYKIDAAHPGTDLAMETAAALAAGSIIFATEDPAYSAILLSHAKQLYTFGNTYRGKYSESITDATAFYNSWSGYNDELVWGAIWLYRATNDATYLTNAETAYNSLSNEGQSSTIKSYKWTINWDDKAYGCYALLAKLTGNSKYYQDIERNLDFWTTGYNGDRITYTPGGLAYLQQWGSLRYSSNASFLALYYGDLPLANTTKKTTYKDFAKTQINYALGSNPNNRSYVCGFGTNPPVNPHHRGAHGTWTNNLSGPPTTSRHTLYGALVGGPDAADDYTDSRSDYIKNEVATDYNSGFSGALARIIADGSAVTLPPVPTEAVGEEYLTSIKSNSTGSSFFEPAIKIQNHTAWPARQPEKLSFRYFIDITEGVTAGYTISDYSVALGGYAPNATLLPGFKLWTGNIYYAEVEYNNAAIYPGGQSESYRECQFRMTGPANTWSSANDFSYTGVTAAEAQTLYVPVYENGVLVYGKEPSRTTVNYTITASAGTNGSVAPTGVSTVSGGSSKIYTITPSTGYQVDIVTVNGVSVGAVTAYTFTNVSANQTIAATFKVTPSYTITASAGTNGTISPVGAATVSSGSSKVYTITSNTGYQIDAVTVNGVSVGAVGTYTFANVTANQTIAATFKLIVVNPTYTITATTGANGTISPLGASSITSGSGKTYTITPNTGYQIDAVTVNGVSVGAVASYAFANVTANQTIAATFKLIVVSTNYSITATSGANGAIAPSGITTVTSGSSKTYTITPSTGYQVDAVTVNGVSVGAVTSYAFANVTANQTISATFKALPTGSSCLLTTFGVPRSSALPTKNGTFKNIYVLGTNGPNLTSATMGTFNWNLENNGLYDFSFNFNASPWYSGFTTTTIKSLNAAAPSVTIKGSGITNFDNNQYYVNLIGDDVVFVEVSGSHAIYFSNSATSPVDCNATTVNAIAATTQKVTNNMLAYPIPVTDILNVNVSGTAKSKTIALYDLSGNVMFQKNVNSNTELEQIDMNKFPTGVYVFVFKSDNKVITKNIIKK
ncbi:glycoside hydrolase family 9 protein [Flavobacterium sp. PL002]